MPLIGVALLIPLEHIRRHCFSYPSWAMVSPQVEMGLRSRRPTDEICLILVEYTSTVVTPTRHFLPPLDGRAFLAFLSASILRDFLISSLLLISRLLPAPSLNLPILFSLASATLFLRSR